MDSQIGVTPNNFHQNYTYTKNKTPKIILMATLLTVLILLIYFIFSYFLKPKDIIVKNIYAENINLAGKTKEEALDLLKNSFSYLNTDKAHFKIAETEFTLTAKELEYFLDFEDAISKAFNMSEKNKFKDFKERQNIVIEAKYSEDKFNIYLEEILKLVPQSDKHKDLMKIENGNLIIYKGNDPIKITKEELKSIILKKFKSSSFKQIEEIPLNSSFTKNIDFNEIFKKIEQEAKDAYINENGQIVKEVNGVKIKLTKSQAEKLYLQSEEKCIIPLEIVIPKVKASDLNKNEFPNKLTEYSLQYPSSFNLQDKQDIVFKIGTLNNLVIQNNKHFSYNNLINGNKNASDSFIATAFYQIALQLNLDVQQIHKNKVLPDYMNNGLDAFVDNSKDLVFRNNQKNPIKINISANNSGINIQIYGKQFGAPYKVKLDSKVKNTVPHKKELIKNFHYDVGYENIKQKGVDGKTIEVYRELIINNIPNGRKLLGTYKYEPQTEIKEIGNKPSSVPLNNQNNNSGNANTSNNN